MGLRHEGEDAWVRRAVERLPFLVQGRGEGVRLLLVDDIGHLLDAADHDDVVLAAHDRKIAFAKRGGA